MKINKFLIFIVIINISFSKSNNYIQVFDKNDEKVTYIYELKNKESDNIKNSIDIFEDTVIKTYENKLILYGSKKNIDKLKLIIDKLDSEKKQVMIKVSLLDVTNNLIQRLSINLNKSKSESLVKYINIDRENKLKKYKDSGDIKLKIMPSIIVLDNENASIKISNLTINLKAKIKENKLKKYVELDLYIEFLKENNKKEYIKTKINIQNNKSVYVSQNKLYENYSFIYKSKSKKIRNLYIEIEASII